MEKDDFGAIGPHSTSIRPNLKLIIPSRHKTSSMYYQYPFSWSVLIELRKCKVTLVDEIFHIPAKRIADLPCSVNFMLNKLFWRGPQAQYHCFSKEFAKMFQYLNCPNELFCQPYPDNPRGELSLDCFLYVFGKIYRWNELSEAASFRIRYYARPGDQNRDIFYTAFEQAIYTDDRPMYVFLMEKLRLLETYRIPSVILPTQENTSALIDFDLAKSPGSAHTEIENEPAEDITL